MHLALDAFNEKRLQSYTADPGLLKEHHGIEQTVLAGGYGYRQILELVQNGADAILEAHEQGTPPTDGNRIHVLLRGERLYVANTGAPLSEEGIDTLLRSHSSPKRGNQIGRFGLGFKSLLRLNGRIDLFTRTFGAIRFDPQRCRDELKYRFNVTDAPGLRLAWPLDESERTADETCAELGWAETIVRVEVHTDELLEHLRQEIRAFRAEFLLFFPVPTILALDEGEQPAREIRLQLDGDQQVLFDGAEISRWRVTRREIRISDARALADATHIHARESVPLAWAVPLEGRREEAGRFWAFFSTHTPTYVPGILNAPWKLNSDRNAIIGGEWNAALMTEAARLIAESLPELSTPGDPARPLDALPRQMERKDEDAAPLVEALWLALETAAVIPDTTGTLRAGRDLWRHPRDNADLATCWQALASEETAARYVHPTCLDRQRNSRLDALAKRFSAVEGVSIQGMLRRCEVAHWFNEVASIEPDKAISVLELAEAYKSDCMFSDWVIVRTRLAIIPSQNGTLVTATEALLAPEGTSVPSRATVAAALYDDSTARRILTDVLEVQAPDDDVWRQVLAEALRNVPLQRHEETAKGWEAFWSILRQAPTAVRDRFLQAKRGQIRIRRRDGAWVSADEALLAGALIGADDASVNQNMLVDETVHRLDGTALAALGLVDRPKGDVALPNYHYVQDWVDACRSRYKTTQANSASRDYLGPVSVLMPRGFDFLCQLTGKPNARLTKLCLAQIASGAFPDNVQFGHRTMSVYPKIDVPHPLSWLVLRHGTVEIGNETVRLAAVVEKRNESALAKLSAWPDWRPALDRLQRAFPRVTPTADDIRAMWQTLIALLATPEAVANDALTDLWTAAATDGVVPESLRTSQGEISLAEVLVTSSPDLARRARRPDRIVVTLGEVALASWLERGARNLSELLEPCWDAAVGPPQLLTAAVPELAEVLRREAHESAGCQWVSGLQLKLGQTVEALPCLMRQGTLLLDKGRLAVCSRAERLQQLVKEISPAGWLDCSSNEALRRLGDARVDELRAHVAKGATLAERLLRAVGGRCEPLLEALGRLKDMRFVQQCTSLQLAELTFAQLGPATLTALKDTLADEGLNPPARWNSSEARAFVVSIGFPPECASASETKREAEEFVTGPIELPRLHDFQREVLHGLQALFASGTKRRRAVVSLPTGGGKTRVMVEAAVGLILAPSGECRSVVWVAQTDELCEQAVQAFRQVWVNRGAQRTDLRIVRLWGRNPDPAPQILDRPVVVVASIQTLKNRMDTERLAWLSKPGLVVVDECHHAITPSYSSLLRWLDAEAPRPSAPQKDEPPIVGLSATPFRTDDEESQRLARRFDNRWLPTDQEALHARLQSQGVFAEAVYQALHSGSALSADEIDRLSRLPEPWEGLDFEKLLVTINQRLAGDEKRNERLVEHIRQSAERSILLFCNSVQHAEEMTARLNLAGITAAAVSGSTPVVARRYFVDRFQRNDIRVLCNHSVLTTGFDAPKTDMVLIARQVFSPVCYMQMVGRGLRGVENGGTASCRIVTVIDNLGRFQDRHPYHYCRQLYEKGA